MVAVAWPTTAELKQRLDITSADWDDQLDRVLATAIDETKRRIGNWVEDYDSPDMARLASQPSSWRWRWPQTGDAVSLQLSKSRHLLYGRRRRFGIG